jgi:hypothetical protein
MRNNANGAAVGQHEAAQKRVEEHLENGAPRDISADDIICQYARDARVNIGNPVWMRL